VRKHIFFSGVSFIEVLMVIAIISILSSISVSGYFYWKKSSDIESAVELSANLIRKARLKACSLENDSAWGAYFQSGSAIIFSGNSFVSRDVSRDETHNLRGISSVSGETEVVFSKLNGETLNFGTLTISDGTENREIQINEKGFISY